MYHHAQYRYINVARIYNGIVFRHEREEISSFTIARMELEDVLLNEISPKEKDKFFMVSLICAI